MFWTVLQECFLIIFCICCGIACEGDITFSVFAFFMGQIIIWDRCYERRENKDTTGI